MNYRNIILTILIALSMGNAPVMMAMLSKHMSEEKIEKIERERSLISTFFCACLKGDFKTVKTLVDQKLVNINFSDKAISYRTSLHLACQGGHLKCVTYLVENGADLDSETVKGYKPIHIACGRGHLEIAQYLLKKKPQDIQALTLDGYSLLHQACCSGRSDLVEFLIKACNAHANAQCKRGITPLYLACQIGDEETVKALLNNKADIESLTFENATPLHIACFIGNLNIVKLLVNRGAILTKKIHSGASFLHLACSSRNLDVIKFLIKAQPSILNDTTNSGDTALHSAVMDDSLLIAQCLLESDASINIKNSAGLSPLDYAYDGKKDNFVQLLGFYGAHLTTDEEACKNQEKFFKKVNQEKLYGKNWAKNQKRKLAQKSKKIHSTTQLNDCPDTLPETQLSIEKKVDARATASALDNQDNQHIISDLIKKVEPTTSTLGDLTNIDSSRFPSPRIAIKTSSKQQHVETKKALAQKPKPECESATTSTDFELLIHEKFKWPKTLNKKQQAIMLDHLRQLKKWPGTIGLDIKELKLKNQSNVFRLRVGGHRVLFSVDIEKHEIKIHEIRLRKSVYKNMKINLS